MPDVRRPSLKQVTRLREAIEAIAIAGARCPSNVELADRLGVSGTVIKLALRALTSEGSVRILVSGQNWRQIEVLAGPRAGAKTAADPGASAPHWIIDQGGKRHGGAERKRRRPDEAAPARKAFVRYERKLGPPIKGGPPLAGERGLNRAAWGYTGDSWAATPPDLFAGRRRTGA